MFYDTRCGVKNTLYKRRCPFHGIATNFLTHGVGVFLAADLSKVTGKTPVLLLRPSFEWMIVTFVATETNSQE